MPQDLASPLRRRLSITRSDTLGADLSAALKSSNSKGSRRGTELSVDSSSAAGIKHPPPPPPSPVSWSRR